MAGYWGSSLKVSWSCLGQLLLTLEKVKWSGRVPYCLTLRLNMYPSQTVWGLCRRRGCSSQTNSVLDKSVLWLIHPDHFSMLNTWTCTSRNKPETNHQEDCSLEAVLCWSLSLTPGSGPLDSQYSTSSEHETFSTTKLSHTHADWIIKPSFSFPQIKYWQNKVKTFILDKTKKKKWDNKYLL